MKTHVLMTAAAAVAMNVASQAATNLLNAPGFEGMNSGPLPDAIDRDVWASFSDGQNNMSVTTAFARSGSQSLQAGPNSANKVTNARQAELVSFSAPGDIEGQTFDVSFWVYYAGGNAPTGGLSWQFLATNPFNVHRLNQGGTISIANLMADTWTEFVFQFSVPVTDPAPVDPNLITNQVKLSFGRNGFVDGATVGSFYIDDTSISKVPEPSVLGLLAFVPVLALRRRHA